MKKFIIFPLVLSLLLLTSHLPVYLRRQAQAGFSPIHAANNKVGIHILNPSEIEKAAELVNSNGGDWGYVTVPIQPTDRDKSKWTQFMNQARQLHLIPILRITTIPHGGTWAQAQATDLVDFANFLNELPWPTKNRYIVIFNEVNRAQEWGGRVDPISYAHILKNAYLIFKQRSPNFFILPAGLDNALPNSATSLSAPNYLRQMESALPDIWNYLDGWTSHAYPNPHFTASPYKTGWQSIVSYRSALTFIKQSLPVFITETGWDQTKFKPTTLYRYWQTAWQIWLKDNRVKAVTPFVLQAGQGGFAKFSFLDSQGKPTPAWQATYDLLKQAGQPSLISSPASPNPIHISSSPNPIHQLPFYRSPFHLLLEIENFFRQLFNLPLKKQLLLNHQLLTVEVAQTPKQISKGLSGRSQLDPNQGMLFIFPTSYKPKFWMKDMHFPLDIIWIKNHQIVDFSLNLSPEGHQPQHLYSPSQPVDMVLEVPAGYVQTHQLKIGDKIDLL